MAAHGNFKPFDEVQEQIDLCAAATVLAYQVVFAVVGYEGTFVDYSSRDYPRRQYSADLLRGAGNLPLPPAGA